MDNSSPKQRTVQDYEVPCPSHHISKQEMQKIVRALETPPPHPSQAVQRPTRDMIADYEDHATGPKGKQPLNGLPKPKRTVKHSIQPENTPIILGPTWHIAERRVECNRAITSLKTKEAIPHSLVFNQRVSRHLPKAHRDTTILCINTASPP
ncbi:hypothetical protein CHS0354_035824 [Potamilus streckersoni]|uniref:Uncharacterized protein n=1 Tax=Potamilus streckersoni TaxID=2493646 RepID=A0AAE0SWL6_9BIVA|nr:hypothetical protein CHS0354_035824 [Potamilus streckersoni]